jgi:RNA-directed DNA polymerase
MHSRRTMTQAASTASARFEQLSLGLPTDATMEQVVSASNIKRAWQRVRANRGAAGVDGVTVHDFADKTRELWPAIRRQLLDGSYEPQPVRRKAIPKPDGSQRMLGIPTVLDRLIQQAVLQVLTPLFDPGFSESSFGYRPRRSAHGAVKQVRRWVKEGHRVAVDLDLTKFFDRVQHDVLMARVSRKVKDRRVLALIGRYLRAGAMVEGVLQPVQMGTPQGGPLSPLLANILLDDLDKELERRGLRFARYADDIVILVRSLTAGRRVKDSVTRWLQRHLRLEVNETKSKVAPINQCLFLGFAFKGSKIRLPSKVLERFRQRVRHLTGRSRGVSWERRLSELNGSGVPWMSGYDGVCACACGSNGGTRAHAFATCSPWERTARWRCRPVRAVRATGACRRRWQPTPG